MKSHSKGWTGIAAVAFLCGLAGGCASEEDVAVMSERTTVPADPDLAPVEPDFTSAWLQQSTPENAPIDTRKADLAKGLVAVPESPGYTGENLTYESSLEMRARQSRSQELLARARARALAALEPTSVEPPPSEEGPSPSEEERKLREQVAKYSTTSAPDPKELRAQASRQLYMVQLASHAERELAEKERSRLEKELENVLRGYDLEVRSTPIGEQGTVYRLQSGPFQSIVDAQSFCAALREHRQDCFVVGG